MRAARRIGLALGAGLALAATGSAWAKGAKPEPKGSAIRDVATSVSVPLNAELSLEVGLPEHFWIQCPRHLPEPTSLDGDGLIVQYMNPRAGSVSMLYVGCVPVHPPIGATEALAARAARTASDFVTMLAKKYDRVEWELFSGPVTLSVASLKVDGVKTSGWRSARYSTRPKSYAGPESVFTAECVLFQPAGTEKLVYVALDAKAGGTTLEKVTERLSVRPTRALYPKARRVQLNDLAVSVEPGRYPVRLIGFDMPPGFVLTPEVTRLEGEWLYAEDRLDADGRLTGTLRIRQYPTTKGQTLAADAESARSPWPDIERGPPVEVSLASAGANALYFWHAATPVPGATDVPGPSRALTALFRVDDQTLVLTLTTFGDAARTSQDEAALKALLSSLEHSARW